MTEICQKKRPLGRCGVDMDILTLKSKDFLGCDNCDKCCVNRGDIKLTPVNVVLISLFLGVSIENFIDNYTVNVNGIEIAIKAVGERNDCVFYDRNLKHCSIHKVEPMQCAMYPLVPENLKRDYFYNKGTCVCKNKKLIKIDKWINGNNGVYRKYKNIYIEWIDLMENLEEKWDSYSNGLKNEIKNILYYDYKMNKFTIKNQVHKRIKKVEDIIKSN